MLAIYRGPGDFYAGADRTLRRAIREAVKQQQLALREEAIWDAQAVAYSFAPAVRRVQTLLNFISGNVMNGRLTSREAYAILGSTVPAHGSSIRWILGLNETRWIDSDQFWNSVPDHERFAERERVLALIDLLWAELARRGDSDAHILIEVAKLKRSSGTHARNRVARASAVVRPGLLGIPLRLKLQWALFSAEFIPPASIYQDGDQLYALIDWTCTRTNVWAFRAMRRYLTSVPAAFNVWGRRAAIAYMKKSE